METLFSSACDAHEIPGVVLLATNTSGSFQYSNAFGNSSLEADVGSAPISPTMPMWIASCTKLITTIAALQCVESSLLTLDDPISSILPELSSLKILSAFDQASQPVYTTPHNPITLRHLLTHSAGMGYDLFNPTLQRWRKSQSQPIAPGTTVASRYSTPLLYEPGTGWEYSGGVDWAGKVVECVTGENSLQSYMEKRIWKPLGITDMAFSHNIPEHMSKRTPAMSYRDVKSGKAVWRKPGKIDVATDAFGGGGIHASPVEYLKVLHAILKNDGTLLKPDTVDQMFTPQLSQDSQAALTKALPFPEVNLMMGGTPEASMRNWGLGGLLIMDDLKDWRRKGTMTWGGMPNLTWWIDREAGLCGLYASQILPPEDAKSAEMSQVFEKEIYRRYAAKEKGMVSL